VQLKNIDGWNAVRKYFAVNKSKKRTNITDILFIRHDADCGYFYRDKVYSPLVDSVAFVAKRLGLRFVVLARPYSSYFGESAHNNPLCMNRYFLIDAIFLRLLSFFLPGGLFRKANRVLRIRRWDKVLDFSGASCVIAIQPDEYLCSSAKKKNIKVYDLQHGVISEDHQWYGKKLRYDCEGTGLPDGVLCWDEYAFQWLKSWGPEKGITPVLIGHPWFDRFFEPNENDDLVVEAENRLEKCNYRKPAILVTLQWGLYEHYYRGTEFNGLISDSLISVIKKTSSDIDWFIRLHPIQLSKKNKKSVYDQLSRIFEGVIGVSWDVPSHLPLPLLLKKVNLHITDMSSVVLEASTLGVPSAILNPHVCEGGNLENLYDAQRRKGLADVVNQNESEILKWITSMLSSRFYNSYSNNRDYLKKFLETLKGPLK